MNYAMQRKIAEGEAIDIGNSPREGKYYRLSNFEEGKDYCDASNDTWIWSIGRRKDSGALYASPDSDLYQNPHFECVWLR